MTPEQRLQPQKRLVEVFRQGIRQVRRAEAGYVLGVIGNSALTMFGSILGAKYSSVQDFGLVNTLLLVSVYSSVLQLGVFNGVNRNIALYTGQGAIDRAGHAESTARVHANWLSLLGLVIAVFYTLFVYQETDTISKIGVFTLLAVILVSDPQGTCLEAVLLSQRRFPQLRRLMAWQNAINVSGAIAPVFFGIYGFIANRVIFYCSRWYLRRVLLGPRKGPADYKELQELVSTGLPLMIGGLLFAYLNAAERSILALQGTAEMVAWYSLANLLATGAQMLPTCVGYVIYPIMAEELGRSGKPSALRGIYLRSLMGVTLALGFLSIVGTLTVGPIIDHILPEFQPARQACVIIAATMWVYVYLVAGAVISVTRRNTPYLIATSIALVTVWAAGMLVAPRDSAVASLAGIKAATMLCLASFSVWYAFRICAVEAES